MTGPLERWPDRTESSNQEKSVANATRWKIILRRRPDVVAAIGAAVVTLGVTLGARLAWQSVWISSVVGVFAALTLLGLAGALRTARKQPVPPAFGQWSERFVSASSQWKILLALGVVFFALREGLLAPDFVVDWHSYRARRTQQSHNNVAVSGTTLGEMTPVTFAGRELLCTSVQCSGGQTFCRSLEAHLPCSPGPTAFDEHPGAAHFRLTVSVQFHGSCWMPLVKSGRFQVLAMAEMQAHERRSKDGHLLGPGAPIDENAKILVSNKTLSFDEDRTLEQTVTGTVSCRSFQWAAGSLVALETISSIRAAARNH